MTFDGAWIAAVRRHLAMLAEVTQTTLPPPAIVNTYLALIHEEASGHRSDQVIGEACKRLAARWKYQGYPKPADIIESVRMVRGDQRFINSIAEQDRARQLDDGVRDTIHQYTDEERARAQAVIREFKARHGLLKEETH